MPAGCFCEAVRDQLVRQPANSVSGLAFVFVGLLILRASRVPSTGSEPTGNPMRARGVYAGLFAAAAIIIGVGSTLYHASLTFWAQTVDVLGMYLIVTLILLYGFARLTTLSNAAAATIFVAVNVALLGGLIVVPEARRIAFAVLVLLAVGLEIVARRKDGSSYRTGWFWAAVLVLAAASAMWTADMTGAACAPHSWLQGHALWHLAGATAIGLIYRYFQSAESSDTDPPAWICGARGQEPPGAGRSGGPLDD